MSITISPDPVGSAASASTDIAEITEITEITETGPSLAARLVSDVTWMTVHSALMVVSRALQLPLPYPVIDRAARALPAPRGLKRDSIRLRHAHAELIRARGVHRKTGRVVLYCHGGGFLCCGINTHLRLIDKLSEFAHSPVLAVDYRMLPKHSIKMALDDCYDAYRWLREHGYDAEQIAIAGDSAGGYLALALAQRLLRDGERPAALALLSPLLQLAAERPRVNGPMLPHHVFAALTALIAAHDGTLYEPLDHIEPDLPPTMIHVSAAEELVHDARLAVAKLTDVQVSAELHTWPGQIHVFQLAAPLVPEATRSLRQIGTFIRAAVATAAEPASESA